jgi:hypothetical protein
MSASVPEWAADLPQVDDLELSEDLEVKAAQGAYSVEDGDDSKVPAHGPD